MAGFDECVKLGFIYLSIYVCVYMRSTVEERGGWVRKAGWVWNNSQKKQRQTDPTHEKLKEWRKAEDARGEERIVRSCGAYHS